MLELKQLKSETHSQTNSKRDRDTWNSKLNKERSYIKEFFENLKFKTTKPALQVFNA